MKRCVTICLILCLGGCQGSCSLEVNQEGPPTKNKYEDIPEVRVVSIYDGDTFTVDIPNYPAIIGKRVPVRIYGIDCPEMRDKDTVKKEAARKAKQRTVELLRGAKCVSIERPTRDKYFRILGVVKVDGVNIAEILFKEGLAKEYYGGKK